MQSEQRLRLALPFKKNSVLRHLLTERFPHVMPGHEEIHATLYDTPGHMLHKHGISLLLRQNSSGWLQTVQFPAKGVSGFESETRPVNTTWLPGPVQHKRLRRFFESPTIAGALQPLVQMDIRRTSWHVQDAEGNIFLIHLDSGHLHQGPHRTRINEIGMERVQGSSHAFYQLAITLSATLPVKVEPLSLIERSYALVTPVQARLPVKAMPVHVDAGMPPIQALQQIAHHALRHFQKNLPGVLEENDPEYIHQARVALRRLISAQKVFAPISNEDSWLVVAVPLKEMTTLLGLVRDVDVFLAETLPAFAQTGHVSSEAVQQLAEALTLQCRQYKQTARAALDAALNCRFQAGFLSWISEPTAVTDHKPPNLKHFSRKVLTQRLATVSRLASQWDELDEVQRHSLRKRIKTLRYAIEFFAPIYPRKAVQHYLAKLQDLQQILGEMNDRCVARAVLTSLPRQTAELADTVQRCAAWLEESAHIHHAPFLAAFAALAETPAFWQITRGAHRQKGK